MNYQPLIERWRGGALDRWAKALPDQLAEGLSPARYGDLPGWLAMLEQLPVITPNRIDLNSARVAAHAKELDAATYRLLEETLMGLHPWRKGPFDVFGVHIDTEWRSDWKWDRLRPALDDLQGRRVLDVGCGSGYHCWRMLGAGAAEVIGIDPSPLFVVQFWALQKYLQCDGVWVLPAGIEAVPIGLKAFDTVFSMGVLYHRRSPLDHLLELKQALRPGGQLLLETLVIDGKLGDTLVPHGRYARMGNVWFLPSCATLLSWLGKLGFQRAEVVNTNRTRCEEQRTTPWMTFHSLQNFLDPQDPNKTIEGYPAPQRAIITAWR
ncbi:MAG: tRNA 5-methoxyuridine(34)/uridine 5-oxyacetic acid(34) synthase CmoB [Pseudomonadota bacterium]